MASRMVFHQSIQPARPYHRHPTHWLVCAQVKVPVGAVWKLLPWNRGLPPTCAVEQVYLDDDVRIAKDTSGQYFVYARPV